MCQNSFVARLLTVPALAALLMGCAISSPTIDGEDENLGEARDPITAEQCSYYAVDGKVAICHATGSARNPFVLIEVAKQACIQGHADHSGDYILGTGPISPLCDSPSGAENELCSNLCTCPVGFVCGGE